MSAVAGKKLLRESIFCFFVRAGDTVDGSVVSATSKPDVSPTDNWPELGCTLSASIEVLSSDDPERLCPQPNGGYLAKRSSRMTRGDIILELEETNNIVRQLRWGLRAKIAAAAAQRPFDAGAENAVYGWLKGQILNETGAVQDRFDLWCRVTLEESPNIQEQLQFPRLRFEMQASDGNTFQPVI